MQILWILIIFEIITQSKGLFPEYSKSSLYDCNADQEYSAAQRQEILTLYPEDAYFFVIIGPITVLASLFLMMVFMKFPSIRKNPGDILLGICVCQFLKTLYYIASGVFYFLYKISPEPASVFCLTSGIIATLTVTGDYLYNVAFLFTPLMLIRNILSSQPYFYNLLIHIIIVSTAISVAGYYVYNQEISLNLSGLCATAATVRQDTFTLHYALFIWLAFYLLTGLLVIRQFEKAISQNKQLEVVGQRYMFIYKRFFIATFIMWTLQVILSTINYYNCYEFQIPDLNITLTLFNLINVITPIILCYIRARDPIIMSKIQKLDCYRRFKSISCLKRHLAVSDPNEGDNSLSQTNDPISMRGTTQSNYFLTTQIQTMIFGALMMNNKQKFQNLDQVGSKFVEDQSYKTQNSKNTKIEMEQFVNQQSYQNFSKDQIEQIEELVLDDQEVQKAFPSIKNFSVFPTKISQYSPDIFQYFLQKDKKMINFEESLDLFRNQDQISTSNSPDGGKSGEFFFFSWDKKVIIKTMQYSEVCTIRKRMFSYSNYLFDNPDSMISKIYGIYTFQPLNQDAILGKVKNIHFLIMRNISLGIPRQFMQKTFDMKGSEYDREVLNRNPTADLSKVTLKDLDFFKTEKQIHIDPDLLELLLNSLQKDAKFFKDEKLIDYSLLVMKVDWGTYFAQNEVNPKSIRKQITNPLYMLKSTKEQGIFYHFAIIDYLQEWNVNKGAEQVTKKIIKLNHKLDTSAQNPDVYADRFLKKLVEKILIRNKDGQNIKPEQR